MEAKLKSVLKSPALALLLKTSLLGITLLWFRGDSYGSLKVVGFLLIFLILYLKPAINSLKFWTSASLLALLVMLVPKIGDASGFYLNLILILLGYMLFGIKNLVFLKKNHIYYLLHILILFGLTSLATLGLLSPIVYFIALFLFFKEFYSLNIETGKNTSNLISAIEAMLSVQMVWITSFFPTTFVIGSSFITLAIMLSHNLFTHHFQKTLNRKNIYKELTIFGILVVLMAILSVWILA